MTSRFLGRVHFASALETQEILWRETALSRAGIVLGFESEKVITLGVRGQSNTDIVSAQEEVARLGFSVHALDRGGQATIHNPGQLVVFPICDVREFGVRHWIDILAETSRQTLLEFGVESCWNPDCPGLYTSRGKILSCGVRIRQGISTHGIAINVCNDLSDFILIRSCGVSGALVDRMGAEFKVRAVFEKWLERFQLVCGSSF